MLRVFLKSNAGGAEALFFKFGSFCRSRPVWHFKKFFFSLGAFLWIPLSYPAKVNRIFVKGNKIIEADFIRDHIQLKKGSFYKEKTVQQDVRHLFSLGFFDEIEAHKQPSKKGWDVLYQVKERPAIGKIEFKGNKSLSKESLKELSLLQEDSFLDFEKLKKTLLALQEKYREKAYYLAEISYEIKKNPKEKKAKLIIQIDEKEKLLIKKIRFIGNRHISSKRLKSFMLTKEAGLLSFLGFSGIFKKKAIERDQQFIEYFYRDKGYLQVRVSPPEIRITPDKRFLYIHFFISEGPRFKMGKTVFEGDKVISSEEIRDRLKLAGEEYFSLGLLQKDIQLISLLYKNKGYAFVKVQPQFFPDRLEEDKIHVRLKAEKGSIYKLRRIRLRGNNNARDKVIFRRFRLKEGEIYNESKKELTKQLLQRLGYFEKVELKLVPVEKNQLDIEAHVKERENTGEAQLAGGYNAQTRLFIQGGIRKQNFLGLDQSIALNLNFNKYQELFNFSYQSPYFLDSLWSFSFDIFNLGQGSLSGGSTGDSFLPFSASQDYFSYFQLNTGFSFSLGRQLTDFFSVSLKYKLENQHLKEEPVYFLRNLPVFSYVFNKLFGEKDQAHPRSAIFSDIYKLNEASGLNSSLSAFLEYDKRNDRYYASRGIWASLTAEYAGWGGDFDWTKWQFKFNHYYSPFWKLVIKNRLSYGLVFSNDKKKPTPFTELFLLGGPYNLRGFYVNSQGPRKHSQKAFEYAKNRLYNIKASQKLLQDLKNKKENPEQVKLAVQNYLQDKQTDSQMAEAIQNVLNKGQITAENLEDIQSLLRDRAELPTEERRLFENPSAFAERPYGGNQMFFYSLELEFPLIERAELRGAFFFDIGEANNTLNFNLNKHLRANVGTGIRWRSPFGPISLDWAFPYKPRKKFGEQNMKFQFNIGAQF